jgi:hypothetical protein
MNDWLKSIPLKTLIKLSVKKPYDINKLDYVKLKTGLED